MDFGLAILDHEGSIVCLNSNWCALEGSVFAGKRHRLGQNYIEFCEKLTGTHTQIGLMVARSIREILTGRRDAFRIRRDDATLGRRGYFILQGSQTSLQPHAGVMLTKYAVRQANVATTPESDGESTEQLTALRRIGQDVGRGQSDFQTAANAVNHLLASLATGILTEQGRTWQALARVTEHMPPLPDETKRDLTLAIDSVENLGRLVVALSGVAERLGLPNSIA